MAERGFLVIADITGYSAFLRGSELDHAEDSLKDLIGLLIEQTKSPLVISRLEGDAVISYAPEASFLQGQTMVEIVENTYVEFREARQHMQLNTSCTCNACQNIPNPSRNLRASENGELHGAGGQ
jgi:sulfate adenylyltransferase subunit 1 (EFTu-like GTPase family)